MAHATFQNGELTAVIGDNSAAGEHRAGYNGVWSLRHTTSTRSLFVPAVAGLNLEHIFNGDDMPDKKLYLDMHFRCMPHQHDFPRGWMGVFWASYINAPPDKFMYFRGGLDEQKDSWMQLCTPWHNDQSTVRHRDDKLDLQFDPGQDTLFK